MRRGCCVAFALSLIFALASATAPAQDVQPDQTIAVLVTTEPGAPTADELVTYYEGPHLPPPPLQGLAVGDPLFITYLMPVRPQGDFLAFLQAHPDSAEAQLYRYVVVVYPSGTNLAAPLAALRADPHVLAAYAMLGWGFSTPPGDVPPRPSAQPVAIPAVNGVALLGLLAMLIGAALYALREYFRRPT
jgi:hypothetical protein